MIALLLTLMGCGAGNETTAQIDCLGMMHTPNPAANWAYIQSPNLAVDQVTGAEVKRCAWVGAKTLTRAAPVMSVFDETVSDAITPIFYLNGQTLRALSGSLSFDSFDSAQKASGTYTVQAIPLEDFSSAENIEISGAFSWCDYIAEEDCPNTPVDPLTNRYTMTTPHLGEATGGLNQCSMVWDSDAQAFIFDMQFGTLSGLNVGRLLADECAGGASTLPPNRLTFKAGNVTGPGSYTFTVENQPGGLSPSLEAVRPQALDSASSSEYRCSLFPHETMTSVVPGSECSVTFDESSVQIDCAEVTESAVLGSLQPFEVTGPFSLSADCALTQR